MFEFRSASSFGRPTSFEPGRGANPKRRVAFSLARFAELLEERTLLSATMGPEQFPARVPLIGDSLQGASITPQLAQSGPLIHIDQFRADPIFAGVDGTGFSTVIIDTGIDLNHPFFGPDSDNNGVADRIVYSYDFSDDDDSDASDFDGHGSNVASIAASSDGTYTGMAPGANIIALKVFPDDPSSGASIVDIVQALDWVVAHVDQYNIASVNLSLGGGFYTTAQTGGYLASDFAALVAKDVFVVSASGNDFYGNNSQQGVSYPAADVNSLSIGAVYDGNVGGFSYGSGAVAYSTGPDRITPFSERSSTLTTVFAPGAPIKGAGPDGDLLTEHGTSQASPHIAGIGALVQQLAVRDLGRRLTQAEFASLLKSTGATINDGDDEDDNVTNTGLDFKRVDVYELGKAIHAMAPTAGDSPGVYRNGKFYLDSNLNGAWNNLAGGDLLKTFGAVGDIPLAGDWDGDGVSNIGVFRNGIFYLDYNGNGKWDNTAGGDKLLKFGTATDIPVVGDWNNDGKSDIGVFRNGRWYLDQNGDGVWKASNDATFTFGIAGDTPVTGDFTGDGKSEVGVFRQGKWYLDLNGDHKWNGVAAGDSLSAFGSPTDIPVTGDWDNSGKDKIGTFRSGTFYLDMNGNRKWNGTAGGDYLTKFGAAGDLPVTGLWTDPANLTSDSLLASQSAATASSQQTPVAASLQQAALTLSKTTVATSQASAFSLAGTPLSNAPVSQNWTLLSSSVPGPDFSAQMPMLLSDGTLLVHGGDDGSYSPTWYRYYPDATGGYQDGTWSQADSMNVGRLYFGSVVLPSGKIFVVGGEYAADQSFSNSAEIYNPLTNVWTSVASSPKPVVGDEPTMVLPDGRVLVGNIEDPGTEIYNPLTNTWSAGGTKIRSDETSDEETWVKLPDDSILTYDIFSSIASGTGKAERYIPSTNTWVDASNGTLPLLSSASEGYELGGAALLPDGRAFFTGANGKTAFYDTKTNTWSQGPTMPTFAGIQATMGDAPLAVMPNGHVLMAVSPEITTTNNNIDFPGPTLILDFDPTTNVYTNVTPPSSMFDLSNNSFVNCMLVLPTGQVMLTNFSGDVVLYTPDGSPDDSWRPHITGLTLQGDGSYLLTGMQLNGLNEGASYGDDNQMSTNFPIVRVTDTISGNAYYARTSNWSLTGVATGSAVETVRVDLPAALGNDPFTLVVIANGIESNSVKSIAGTGLGTFRNGHFYLDTNLNQAWNNVSGGDTLDTFGIAGDTPLSGDWNGDGIDQIGVFRNGVFYLDYNGNGKWDNTSGGDKFFQFGNPTDKPVVGDWNKDGKTDIGVFRDGKWYLDLNGDGKWDAGDSSFNFGTTGDIPIAGDFNGDGRSEIGVFRQGRWYLDLNGNHKWDGPAAGDATPLFGNPNDIPVIGDWNSSGKDKIGVFRNGEFYLDVNGNRHWNGTAGGDVLAKFGSQGDLPVAGFWVDPHSLQLITSAQVLGGYQSVSQSVTLTDSSSVGGSTPRLTLATALEQGAYIGFASAETSTAATNSVTSDPSKSSTATASAASSQAKSVVPLPDEGLQGQLGEVFANLLSI
ncbi:MAG: S8 family serine peptidase [Planctomycetales bacterium]